VKDYYRILGIPENASDAEIKTAYRRLAKRYHPDMNAGDKRSEERFKEIAEAYNTLSDAVLKRSYDLRRMRNDLYAGNPVFYSPAPKEKKDARRREYSEADLSRARARHRHRTAMHIRKRKRILVGMIVTFIIYLFATAAFERWSEKQRQKEAEQIERSLNAMTQQKDMAASQIIQDMDTPYDSLFGKGENDFFSPNYIAVFNPVSDALICVVQAGPPYRTVRNAYASAHYNFVLRYLPDGAYYIKVYTGEKWDKRKKIPGGQTLGGFTQDEEFFRINQATIRLERPTPKHGNTITADTIVIDPSVMNFQRISREEFYDRGK